MGLFVIVPPYVGYPSLVSGPVARGSGMWVLDRAILVACDGSVSGFNIEDCPLLQLSLRTAAMLH